LLGLHNQLASALLDLETLHLPLQVLELRLEVQRAALLLELDELLPVRGCRDREV
jgi:hypothetical protein